MTVSDRVLRFQARQQRATSSSTANGLKQQVAEFYEKWNKLSPAEQQAEISNSKNPAIEKFRQERKRLYSLEHFSTK